MVMLDIVIELTLHVGQWNKYIYIYIYIYMVAHIYRCLQFSTAGIQTISGNDILFIYLSTSEKYIIPLGPQAR